MIVLAFDDNYFLAVIPVCVDLYDRIVIADVINGAWKAKIDYDENILYSDRGSWVKCLDFTKCRHFNVVAPHYNEAFEIVQKMISEDMEVTHE